MERETLQLLTTEEVLQMLRITKSTLFRWIKEGIFPKPLAYPKGKRLWAKEDIEEFVKRQRKVA